MLLLQHLLQRKPVFELINMEWAAKQFDTSPEQLYLLLHRDNKVENWFWKLVETLERKGWPIMNLVEHEGRIHYDAITKDAYDVEVEYRVCGYVMTWRMKND